jgi:hypothetical protein
MYIEEGQTAQLQWPKEKKDKRTSKDLQNTIWKTNDGATRTTDKICLLLTFTVPR